MSVPAVPGPPPEPTEPPEPPVRPARSRMDRHPRASVRRLVLETLLGCAALALVGGLVWAVLAPRVAPQESADGLVVSELQAGRVIGLDGWFAVVAAGCGLLAGAVLRARHDRRPVHVVVALVLGGLVGSGVMVLVGRAVGPDPVAASAASGGGAAARLAEILPAHLQVQAPGVLLVWSMASMLAALLVAALEPERVSPRPPPARAGRSGRAPRR